MIERTRRSWTLVLLLVALSAGCGGQKSQPQSPPELDVNKKMQLAQSLMKAGRVGEAMAQLDEAVAEEPDNARLHQFYGETCIKGGLLAEAETAFKRALELDPYLTDAHLYLGAVYQEMDRLGDAETEYLAALNNPAYPRPERIYLGLGMLYQRQRRLDEAEENLRMSVGIDPKFYKGHFELAGILEEKGDLEAAVRSYEVAEPGFRNDAQYNYRIGFAYFRLGDRHLAREHLNRALDIAPGSPVAQEADELLRMMD